MRERRRRIAVALLLIAALIVTAVPAVRDAVSSLLGRGVTSVMGALTGRDGEVERLTRENIAANNRARQAEQRLAAAHVSDELNNRFGGDKRSVVVARAIAFTPTPRVGGDRKVQLNVGSRDGIAVSQPVVTELGLAGRVSAVQNDSCTVTLLGDPASVVGARIEGTKALARLTGSAPAGTARRSGDDVTLIVAEGGSVSVGDVVVTAGSPNGFPYPPDLPLGRVSHVDADHGQSERTASVTPYAEPGALDFVGVLVPQGR